MVDEGIVQVREIDAACPRCGWDVGEWATGISVEETLRRVLDDRLSLDELFAWTCPKCGYAADRSAAIATSRDDGNDTLPLEEQRQLVARMSRLLRERSEPGEMSATLRREYGVEGFYVRS